MKKLFIIILLCIFSMSFNNALFAQNEGGDNSGGLSGTESGEVMIASGGTVRATCTGNVPFDMLVVMGGFNNIVIDPSTGELQLNIEIEKETHKNILNFKLTTLFDPEEVLSGFLQGKTIPLNDDNLMLTLTSTNKTTGETINVGNQVRGTIETEQGKEISTDSFIPVMGSLQVMTRNNLASGFIRVAFDNTSRAIEKASEAIGENITIDENGEAALIGRFQDIPINGSFQDLSGFDPENLPHGVMLSSLPRGIDFNNLPGFLDSFNLPEGLSFEDIVGQIPEGFNLSDVLQLPPGFNVEDLANIPPFFGFTPEDLNFLPESFNLNDLVNLPPGLDLSAIPIDKIIDFIGVSIPSGFDFSSIVDAIINGTIDPINIPDINSDDPNILCENGMIKSEFAPFVQFLPEEFICPSSGTSTSSGGIPSGFDLSTICQDGMVKPEFAPFVPPDFTCDQI